ncbi:hypothetical protein QM467_04660 [Rhodoblastus sp. 17X3]|uniref:hypothetical protein n=1 Tax=Rhodoblastus sp. 17X3 TaxID=3047026 RepID=UPI0024B69A51|nr:hypothetical protein [Rhodoblastus sp. 17X3]MDI9847351.1 hypothetical protein [Rhodoblastus sp. 17X3]
MSADDFFTQADQAVRGAVADLCAKAGAEGTEPEDVCATLLSILVACAFDVAEATPLPSDRALQLVCDIATRHAAICAAEEGAVGNA